MKSDRIVMLRIVVLMIGVCLFFVGLAGRLYYLQIIIAPKIVKSSGSQSIYKRFLYATRGHIFDRNGRALALHEKKYNIIANKIIGNKIIIKNITETVWQVGTILKDDPEFKMDPTAIQKHVRALQREKIKSREILRNLSEAQKDLVMAKNIPGISKQEIPCRFYPEGELAGHLLGFTGTDNKGLAGLEYSLNEKLESPQPEYVVRSGKDRRLKWIAEEDYTQFIPRGADAVLTLDSYIQFVAERELEKACKKTEALQAQAVVLHPESGEILALAHYPGFDPNQYKKYAIKDRQNRILVQHFEPGSIVKPFILVAALEQEIVAPQTVFYCEKGDYYFRGHHIRDDIHQFEDLSVRDILVQSSNIGFVKIAQEMGDNYRTQAKVLYDYLRRFGFKDYSDGVKTTNDLPGESCGILRKPKDWQPANIGAIPFGQNMSTNVLILAAAYGALANRGVYCKPSIVRGFRGRDGIYYPRDPESPYQIVSNKVVEAVVKMMVDVTEDPKGTGRRVRIPGFHIAGKTGTAQKVDPKTGRYGYRMRIASFGGFFPAEDPQAVIIVMVDEPKKGKYGGEVAGPVWKAIAEELVAYWGLSPTNKNDPLLVQAETSGSGSPTRKKNGAQPDSLKAFTAFGITKSMPIQPIPRWPLEPGRMPNLVGLPLREAYVRLAVNGLKADFQGAGKVVAQGIPAGTPLNGIRTIGMVRCESVLSDPDIISSGDWVVNR